MKFMGKNRAFSIVGTALIGIVLSILIMTTYFSEHLDNYGTEINEKIASAEREYSNSFQKDFLYREMNEDGIKNLAGYAAFCIDTHGYTRTTMSSLMNSIGVYTGVFYFEGTIDKDTETLNGTFHRNSGKKTLEISDERLYELLSSGMLRDGEYTLVSAPTQKGYAILEIGIENILLEQSILSSYYSNYEGEILRVDKETGIIEDSSNSEQIGLYLSDIIDPSEISRIVYGEGNFVNLKSNKNVYLIASENELGQIFYSYVGIDVISSEAIRNIFLPLVLSWIFLIMLLIYVLKFSKNQAEADIDTVEYVRVPGKKHLNRKLISHINGIAIFAFILVFLSLVYVQTLINYSNQNMAAKDDLASLDYLIDLNAQNDALMEEDYTDTTSILVDCISMYYMEYPEELSNESLTVLNGYLPSISQIAVYNRDGMAEYDSGDSNSKLLARGRVGYTLSFDEDSVEHVCYDVLYGTKDHAGYISYDVLNVVGRRQDKEGLVMVAANTEVLNSFSELTSTAEVLKGAYFGYSDKLIIDKENPQELILLEDDSNKVLTVTNTLSEAAMTNDYAGHCRINGSKYYVNTSNKPNSPYILLSARKSLTLNGLYNIKLLIGIAIAFILQTVLFVFTCSIRFGSTPVKESVLIKVNPIRESIENQMMDSQFRKILLRMLTYTFIIIATLLGVDSLVGRTSLINYLFNNEWPKGINLFSLTMIFIAITVAIVLAIVLKQLIEFFCKNMGPRGVTIGKMLTSVIRFMILIVLIITILVDLGVNLAATITGAGILGAMISFCAQQTINDMLSGFFIIFENLFNIGDWITVGEFRGEVIDIGIRATKIAFGGNVQIVSNSELKKVTLMSLNKSGAVCNVDIAYKEDIDRVIELIKANKELYLKEIPAITEGPYVDGVIALGESGITLFIWALADQEYAPAVERSMRRITKKLFDENGIEIPFNQITVHTGD